MVKAFDLEIRFVAKEAALQLGQQSALCRVQAIRVQPFWFTLTTTRPTEHMIYWLLLISENVKRWDENKLTILYIKNMKNTSECYLYLVIFQFRIFHAQDIWESKASLKQSKFCHPCY